MMNFHQKETMESFDYQWANLNNSPHNSEGGFLDKSAQEILDQTKLPAEWFVGKTVLDAGCGAGRFAYGLALLGAKVLAVDYSPSGLKKTLKVCKGLDVTVRREDLLRPSEWLSEQKFDLVFSWGVLHHTGNVTAAFDNLSGMVKPGGFLFVYLYGKNKPLINLKANFQRLVLSFFPFKVKAFIFTLFKPKELQNEYFDAYSPLINDQLSASEIFSLYDDNDFIEVKRTRESLDHFFIGKKA